MRPYEDVNNEDMLGMVNADEGLNGCRGILNMLGVSFIVVFLVIIGLLLYIPSSQASGCVMHNDNVDDNNMPVGVTDYCGVSARITLVCNQVQLTAYYDDTYAIQEHYGLQQRTVTLLAGQSYTFTPNNDTEWLEVWDSYGFVGLVDIVAQDCGNVVYPDDNRVNWQLGDHYAKVYLVGNYVHVYDVTSGSGELILNVDTSYLQVTCTPNVCVFVRADEIQINITDDEGKFYEIILEGTTWN